MREITFPLSSRMKGPQVADLHEVLQVLVDRAVLVGIQDPAREEVVTVLQRERATSTYGTATRKLVGLFQELNQLQPTGAVDKQTAEALNALLPTMRQVV